MQDEAHCHTCKASMNYLNSLDLDLLPWPDNSSDLKQVENGWAYLKHKVYQRRNTSLQIKKNTLRICSAMSLI